MVFAVNIREWGRIYIRGIWDEPSILLAALTDYCTSETQCCIDMCPLFIDGVCMIGSCGTMLITEGQGR